MVLLYSLILLALIFTIVLKVKSFKTKPKRTTDEVNNQEYLVSSDEKITSDNKSNNKEIENNDNSKKEKQPIISSNESNIVENKTENQEQPIVNQQVDETPKNEIVVDDSVDPNGFDYHIHKGRIDCSSADGCMDISIPIQLKYKKSISNVNYIEVIAKSDKTLGYFIDYVFVEYNYGSIDKCNEIGNSIKTKLSDRVTGFTCSPEGILKINKDY